MLIPASAGAWEAQTTSAGLAEQAALASKLHLRLEEQLGWEGGLYASLTVPPKDAPGLFEILHDLLNPTEGYVPDGRGRLSALGWLVAGAVVADTPAKHAAHHFYDPATGKGLSDATLDGAIAGLKHRLASRAIRERIARSGLPAVDWIASRNNRMNVAGFRRQYVKAVASGTPAERSRHMAGTLLAAGAMLHVLQDMASPSHVRNDLAAHLEVLSSDDDSDVGSRFERVAALAFARLGVPPPDVVVSRPSVRAYFTDSDREGLADRTARRWFSAYTVPRPIRLPARLDRGKLGAIIARELARHTPGPSLRLDSERQMLVDKAGICVANVIIDKRVVRFDIGDDCALEQLAVILPEAAGYGAGFLDTLWSASLTVSVVDGGLAIAGEGVAFGAGTVRLFWDDRRGVRTEYAKVSVPGGVAGASLGTVAAPPAAAKRVIALYEGVGAAGQPLLATRSAAFPIVAPSAAATATTTTN